jgi:hypothetical protein
MTNGIISPMKIHVRSEFAGLDTVKVSEPIGELLRNLRLSRTVKLCAITGGQYRGFFDRTTKGLTQSI